jgi:hypothetical protein
VRWFQPKTQRDAVSAEISRDNDGRVREVTSLFDSLKMTKTASSHKQDVHLFVDPHLASNYNINLHIMDGNDSARQVSAAKEDKQEDREVDFREETLCFPSRQSRDPNYICSIVLQKPEGNIFVVSAYLLETYLGQYAFKSNYYFREGSGVEANRCFDRVLGHVTDLREEIIKGAKNQNEVPYLLRLSLQDEAGEIEHKTDKIAVYLDPSNVPPKRTIGSENILTVPNERSLDLDLDKSSRKSGK